MKEKLERIDVSKIKDPAFVKRLGYGSLTLLCHDIRSEIITKTSLYGGHLASNLGVVELTVALFRSFDFPKDKLIFDVGHQSYTEKILTGRSLDHLRQEGGPSGFERRKESPYDCYEAGHSSTSLSAAQGFAIARDLHGDKYDVVAVIGDSSVVNGLAFEALNNIGSRSNKVIIVLNDNDMSISRPIGGIGNFFRKISTGRLYNKFKSQYRRVMYRSHFGHGLYNFTYYLKNEIKAALVPTTMFDNMGFTYIGPVDGHNLKALAKAFKRAKTTTKSVVVHVTTLKGKGYEPAEHDNTGYWHGVTPFEIESGEAKQQHPDTISWSHYFGGLTQEYMRKNLDTVLICPAMVKGSHLEAAFSEFPKRCFDVGIGEEHALTLAGALALNGLHPIVSIYSTFLQRAYDELLHDCARLGVDMTLLIDRAGLVGADGSTHMGLYDEAYLKSIPGIILSMPSTFSEARYLYEASLEKGHGVLAIRYPHHLTPLAQKDEKEELPFGRWRFLSPLKAGGKAVIALGPNGHELFNLLEEKSYDAAFINPLFLNPIDPADVEAILGAKEVYIYDAYGTENGFAESLLSALMKRSYKGTVRVRAIANVFVDHGSVASQEEHLGVRVKDALADLLGDVGI